jgi:hypothetical protein
MKLLPDPGHANGITKIKFLWFYSGFEIILLALTLILGDSVLLSS